MLDTPSFTGYAQCMDTTITKIRAVATASNGGKRLAVVEREAPAPQAGETLIAPSRIGVNFIEVLQRRGSYPVPPGTVLGFEAVGTAPDGRRCAVIDVFGTYAQRIAVPSSKLIPVPDDVSDDQAMLLFQGVTAHSMIATAHPIRAGEIALVYAAAGGVGSILMQVIKAAGARPIGVVSSEAKAAPLRERGYEVLIGDGTDTRLLREAVPEGAHVAFDPNGAATWELTLESMRPRGHIVLFGAASGQVPPFPPSLLQERHSLTVSYCSIFDHIGDPEERRARTDAVFGWLRSGTVVPLPFHTFPLERANDALDFLESRRSTGKILLLP